MTDIETSEVEEQAPKDQIHWPSAIQFGLSGTAILGLWGLSGTLLLGGLLQTIDPTLGPGNATGVLMMATGSGFAGLLVLPSAAYSLARLLDRPLRIPESLSKAIGRSAAATVVLFFPLLAVGQALSQVAWLAWIALPPVHVLAISAPIIFLLWAALRKTLSGSGQRLWGVFGAGLVLGPLLILIAEVMLFVIAAVGASIYLISSEPEIVEELERLRSVLTVDASIDPEAAMELLGPYLVRRETFAGVLFFTAVLVPLIEEALKPIGVWLLAGRRLSEREGFVLGAISGAGYALFENLTIGLGAEGWALVVLGRGATAVIHIATAGLTGWALARAWREQRYIQLGAAYLAAVLIHGLWNGMVVLFSFSSLVALVETDFSVPAHLAGMALIVSGILALGSFALLLAANRKLREAQGASEIAV